MMTVAKQSGGVRHVSIFQIPDAAVSSLYYDQLLSKNKHRFSSFAYAYRNDRNVHFAIQDLAVDLSQYSRTFVAEFDFSDFFGSISHDFLRQQFDKNGFFISSEERNIISGFLSMRDRGIPQGTSISLFLANLTCWEMDKMFEKNGLRFARYADDTVVWSQDYVKICKAFQIIDDFSKKAGVPINPKKSQGISLLCKEGIPAELSNAKHAVDFLGYSISPDNVSIKGQSVRRIQKQITYILYRNLIQPLKGASLRSLKIPANGRDYGLLVAIMQIRRYLYGNLTEAQIRDFMIGRKNRLIFKGLMSYYPLVNDEEQLKELDGWLVSVIYRSLKLRSRLFSTWGHNVSRGFPYTVKKEDLVEKFAQEEIGPKKKNLLQIPSFLRIYMAVRKGLIDTGIERTMNPSGGYYQ
jgi:RNA-directed DNA polymerase